MEWIGVAHFRILRVAPSICTLDEYMENEYVEERDLEWWL